MPARTRPKAPAHSSQSDREGEIERLHAEVERLRESEKMYRFSAEISGRLVWSTDADGRVVAISRIFKSLTGIGDEIALKQGWIEAVHPDDRQRVLDLWEHCLRTGDPFMAEFRGLLPDGTTRRALSRAMASRDKDGRIRRWYGSTEDVESEREAERARREAEARLRASEELHRFTLELTRQIVWSVGPDGSGLTVGRRFYELTGMDPDDEARLAIHPDERGAVVRAWQASLESGEPLAVECRLRTRDGAYRYFRVRAAALRDEAGAVLRWYGMCEDIHEERIADQARRDVEERYRLAIQATDDAIWDYDIVAGTVEWSANSSGLFGASDPLAVTPIRWWEERIHPEDRARVERSLAEAVRGRVNRWSASYRFRREDGGYAIMLDRGFIMRDADGRAVRAVGAMADLTDRHRAEAEIRRIQADLIHVSRLSAMGTMASTLAHELNQPLAAVTNFLSGAKRLAAARSDDPAPLLAAVEGAASAAQRAAEIIRRLRELVLPGAARVETESLCKLVEEAGVVALIDAHRQGVRHEVRIDPKAQWVRADRIQVQQVLINLIRNAVEAMEESVVRELLVQARPAPNDLVEVSVADTGSGIPGELMGELFSQFMTTKRGGMGLGLPICRTIVESHGGTIQAENRPEGGALLRFTLPRGRPDGRQRD